MVRKKKCIQTYMYNHEHESIFSFEVIAVNTNDLRVFQRGVLCDGTVM